MGAENAELVQIAPVTREEIGTAGKSAVGLELRPLPQGTKSQPGAGTAGTASLSPECREHRDACLSLSLCLIRKTGISDWGDQGAKEDSLPDQTCTLSKGRQREGGAHKPGLVRPEALFSVSVSCACGSLYVLRTRVLGHGEALEGSV